VAVGESDDVHDGSAGHGGGDLAQQPRHLLTLRVAVMLVEKHTSSGETFTLLPDYSRVDCCDNGDK